MTILETVIAEVDILSVELKLREELQNEYLVKLKDIEKRYEESCEFNQQLFKEQTEKLKSVENKCREQIVLVLTECSQKMKDLEEAKQNILKENSALKENFDYYKQHMAASEEACKRLLRKSQTKIQV